MQSLNVPYTTTYCGGGAGGRRWELGPVRVRVRTLQQCARAAGDHHPDGSLEFSVGDFILSRDELTRAAFQESDRDRLGPKALGKPEIHSALCSSSVARHAESPRHRRELIRHVIERELNRRSHCNPSDVPSEAATGMARLAVALCLMIAIAAQCAAVPGSGDDDCSSIARADGVSVKRSEDGDYREFVVAVAARNRTMSPQQRATHACSGVGGWTTAYGRGG